MIQCDGRFRPIRLRGAFTLVEAVISMVIVSVMLVAALNTVGATVKAEYRMGEREKGLLLANALMEEILQDPYEDESNPGAIGTESGESSITRTDFDDVDDYDLWTGAPQDRLGNLKIASDGYVLAVGVGWVSPDNLAVTSGTETGVKEIVVSVTRDGRKITELRAYRTASTTDPIVSALTISKGRASK